MLWIFFLIESSYNVKGYWCKNKKRMDPTLYCLLPFWSIDSSLSNSCFQRYRHFYLMLLLLPRIDKALWFVGTTRLVIDLFFKFLLLSYCNLWATSKAIINESISWVFDYVNLNNYCWWLFGMCNHPVVWGSIFQILPNIAEITFIYFFILIFLRFVIILPFLKKLVTIEFGVKSR